MLRKMKLECRLMLLQSRTNKENGKIIKKIQRQLRNFEK